MVVKYVKQNDIWIKSDVYEMGAARAPANPL